MPYLPYVDRRSADTDNEQGKIVGRQVQRSWSAAVSAGKEGTYGSIGGVQLGCIFGGVNKLKRNQNESKREFKINRYLDAIRLRAYCMRQAGACRNRRKKIDQTAAEASKRIGEATDEIGRKLGEQGEKASVTINDAEITTKEKQAYLPSPV